MIAWFILLANADIQIPQEKDLLEKEHIEVLGEKMECSQETCTVTNAGKDVIATYNGKQGDTTLTAKTILFFRKNTNAIDAKDTVCVIHVPHDKKKTPITITADKGHYENKIITLSGHVVVKQDDRIVKGDRGEANLETHRIKIFGTKDRPASAHLIKDLSARKEKKL